MVLYAVELHSDEVGLGAKMLDELARSNLKLPACNMPDNPDNEKFALREHLRAAPE